MEFYYYSLFLVFTIIAFMIVIDPNVGRFIDLIVKITGLNIERFFWKLKYHPNNFVTTWIQNRKYDKLAKELHKEFEDKLKNENIN